MESEVVNGIGLIVLLGIGLQWWPAAWACPPSCCCWWVGSSSGRGSDLVDPELIFGESLFPIVSLAVRPPAVQRRT